MHLCELQAELRQARVAAVPHAEEPSTALMVEAAELPEVFQWLTPEQPRLAHQDAGSKEQIGEEVADVLLYPLPRAGGEARTIRVPKLDSDYFDEESA